MSAIQDRRVRRETRRLVGLNGAKVINRQAELLREHEAALQHHTQVLQALDATWRAFASMPWWKRVRWVLTGR